MMNAGGRGKAAAAFSTVAEMVVMRANHNRFVLQFWISAGENADDVEGRRFTANDLHDNTQIASRTGTTVRRARVSNLLQAGEIS